MRYLFIMRGCPGSGKTTFLKENNFEHMSLGFDQAREMFSGLYPTFEGESISLSSYGMKKCIDFVFNALSERMDRGETLFFDATSLKQKDISRMANEGNRYGYTTYIIDMQKDTSWEEIVHRNNTRPIEDKVPEEKLLTMFENGKNSVDVPGVENLDKNSFWNVWNNIQIQEIDGNQYDNIYIVGDIQSCPNSLGKAISDNTALDDEKSLWIFAGDLFDRGPNAAEVFSTIYPHLDNIILVEGNHETNMRRVISGTAPGKMFKTTRTSYNQIISSGYEKSDIKQLLKHAVPGVIIHTPHKRIVVTHGGIHHDIVHNIDEKYKYLPAHSIISGTSEREYVYMGKCNYNIRDYHLIDGAVYDNTIQVHGHRNAGDYVTTIGTNTVINVENKVEFEGSLRVVHINEHGIVDIKEYIEQDSVESGNQSIGDEKSEKHILQLNSHPYIIRKEIEDGICAYNFSRAAFQKGIWDNISTTARGLMIKNDTVVARGFNKFFEPNDWSGHGFSLQDMYNPDKFSYPVTVQEKINGYLVLISVIDGKLRFFSKSGITDYSLEAENIFYSTIEYSDVQKLIKTLHKNNVTLACEAVTPLDPHIVNYNGSTSLSPLACIKNDWKFQLDKKAYRNVQEIFENNSISMPEEIIVNTPDELQEVLDNVKNKANTEGVVIIDGNNNMVKFKSHYYTSLKKARSDLRKVAQEKSDRLKKKNESIQRKIDEAKVNPKDYFTQGIHGEVLDIPRLAKDISLYDL